MRIKKIPLIHGVLECKQNSHVQKKTALVWTPLDSTKIIRNGEEFERSRKTRCVASIRNDSCWSVGIRLNTGGSGYRKQNYCSTQCKNISLFITKFKKNVKLKFIQYGRKFAIQPYSHGHFTIPTSLIVLDIRARVFTKNSF